MAVWTVVGVVGRVGSHAGQGNGLRHREIHRILRLRVREEGSRRKGTVRVVTKGLHVEKGETGLHLGLHLGMRVLEVRMREGCGHRVHCVGVKVEVEGLLLLMRFWRRKGREGERGLCRSSRAKR